MPRLHQKVFKGCFGDAKVTTSILNSRERERDVVDGGLGKAKEPNWPTFPTFMIAVSFVIVLHEILRGYKCFSG